MKNFFIIWISITQGFGQKVPAEGTNQANAQDISSDIQKCQFQQTGSQTFTVLYNRTQYKCLDCENFTTLFHRDDLRRLGVRRRKLCGAKCNGIRCHMGGNKYNCIEAADAGKTPQDACAIVTGRAAVRPPGDRAPDEGDGTSGQQSGVGGQVPLIIGFTVGGILLAIVVAGILLGRNQRSDDRDGSEALTTPVSLSNSEWHSNGNSSSSRRNRENMRVQEASTEDLTAVPLYEIAGDVKECHQDENANDYFMKSTDSSISGRESYNGSDLVNYYPQHNCNPSNRSSEVVLEDGYVPGGNFVGSSDLLITNMVQQNGCSAANCGVSSSDRTLEQTFFNGQTPGRMTDEDLTMSLTHTAYDGLEYVIEDEDLMTLNVSQTGSNKTSDKSEMQVIKEAEDHTREMTFQCRDSDSDFEDNSQPTSAVKSDKSDVFFTPNTQSPNCEANCIESVHISRVDSPCSESGIEVSCNSKDSHEIQDDNTKVREVRSWNENCKGRPSDRASQENHNVQDDRNNTKWENRSKSCNWKSPAAPTHSSSRKKSAHCLTSASEYLRPNPTNLTHVFVDVHRNMTSSDEDLLAHNSTDESSSIRHSMTNSQTSSWSDLALSDSQETPEHEPFDSQNKQLDPAAKLARQKRNKSLYLLRDVSGRQTQEWTPRTVRFSSSGSGEYAIPFGSLVP